MGFNANFLVVKKKKNGAKTLGYIFGAIFSIIKEKKLVMSNVNSKVLEEKNTVIIRNKNSI